MAQPRIGMGPGGRGGHGGRNMGIAKMPKGGTKIIFRLLKYVAVNYKWSLLTVMVCILITSATTLTSTLFTRTLIDDYILPLTKMDNPDFNPLAHALENLAVVLVAAFASHAFAQDCAAQRGEWLKQHHKCLKLFKEAVAEDKQPKSKTKKPEYEYVALTAKMDNKYVSLMNRIEQQGNQD